MGLATALIAGSSLIGGAMQARSAQQAGQAQERAAAEQAAIQREMFDLQRQDMAPFVQGGGNALAAMLYNLGLGTAPMIGGQMPTIEEVAGQQGLFGSAAAPRFRVNGQMFDTREAAEAFARQNMTGGTPYQGYMMSPGAQIQLREGVSGIDASAAARGGLRSGATLAAQEQMRNNLVQQDFGNYFNRLAGIAGMGQAGAAGQAAAAGQFGQNMGNVLANRGDAQAAAAIGQGNAWGNAFGNLASTFGYMSMNRPAGQGVFRGNSWG